MEKKLANTNTFFKSISRKTYKDQAYEILKDAIIYRRLKAGQIYSQDRICEDLNISRTPVREALLELRKEGYVSFLRGRGIEILPVDQKEANDIMELRKILEISGCRLAAERASECQIKEIKFYIDQMAIQLKKSYTSTQLYKLDRSFHKKVCAATNNSWLLEMVERCREHYLRVENQEAFNSIAFSKEIVAEHFDIYCAIRQKNGDLAAQSMKKHLDNTEKRTLMASRV